MPLSSITRFPGLPSNFESAASLGFGPLFPKTDPRPQNLRNCLFQGTTGLERKRSERFDPPPSRKKEIFFREILFLERPTIIANRLPCLPTTLDALLVYIVAWLAG
ncbi:hypothetical protein [Bradyrhizobium diazoefficiens]